MDERDAMRAPRSVKFRTKSAKLGESPLAMDFMLASDMAGGDWGAGGFFRVWEGNWGRMSGNLGFLGVELGTGGKNAVFFRVDRTGKGLIIISIRLADAGADYDIRLAGRALKDDAGLCPSVEWW